MKNFKKVIFALMVVFLVVGFIGCKTESDPPKAEVEKWTVVYGEDSLKEGTYAELEEYAGKVGLDETTDYTVDKTNKKIILTDSGMSKVTAYEENNAGNDDNNDEENGSSGGNTGNDNPGNTDTPETPVVTNNFKGKTFLGMTGEGEAARFASYIIFTSDTDCEVMFFDKEPMSAKYTVADDVATLIGTGEYAALQLSTTKLTDGKFSITIPTAVSGEEEDIVVSYAVGTLWTILYADEDFSLKMPEEELEAAVEHFGFEEDDYTKDDATKTITLTADGWAKVQAAMGGGSGEEGGNTETPETPVVTNNFMGKTFLGMTGEGEDAYFASYIIFTSDKDCEVMFFDEEPMPATYTVADDVATLTGTGEYAVLQISTTKLTDGTFEITIPPAVSGEAENIVVSYEVGTLWTILYADEDFSLKMPEEELEAAVEHFGFVDGDFTKNDATKTVTLTDAGWDKVQDAMGGDTEGGDSGEVYYYKHNGELCGGQNTLEDFYYEVELYDLVEVTDYTIDYKNGYIDFTDSGYAKLGY